MWCSVGGALGRNQTYVSTGNPSFRKNNGRRGGAREGAVLGAGVGPGSGGNRVRFLGELEQVGVPANKRGVGTEVPRVRVRPKGTRLLRRLTS